MKSLRTKGAHTCETVTETPDYDTSQLHELPREYVPYRPPIDEAHQAPRLDELYLPPDGEVIVLTPPELAAQHGRSEIEEGVVRHELP